MSTNHVTVTVEIEKLSVEEPLMDGSEGLFVCLVVVVVDVLDLQDSSEIRNVIASWKFLELSIVYYMFFEGKKMKARYYC